ncbi:MAG: helix-turn-helix transcriptional regulator [Ruminococcaceae bacterium]|nr:helix-turn-helix transcriptional regulator [Oscillospiraceae bacterium]
MTVGQRIAQKRKESGLSQEALGDALGVSRQSIYKWESGAALPEIDKLIALAELFRVSVGWLLGVEDVPPAPEEPPEHRDELSQAQLKMVEEIVDRYLAAQPKPPKRKKWPMVLAAVVLLAVGANLFSRLDTLSDQYRNLQSSVSGINHNVTSQISGISNRVEKILKEQNHLAAEYDADLIGSDLHQNTVTFSAHAVPKTYTEGMTAAFVADSGTGPTEIPATLGPGRSFSGEITTELTDSISLSVVFIGADGTRETQVLYTFTGLFTESFPAVNINDFLIGTRMPEDSLELHTEYATVRIFDQVKALPGAPEVTVTEIQLGVFLNKTLLGWATPAQRPANFHGSYYDDAAFYTLPAMTVKGLTEGDTLYVAALVTDSCGRQWMACDIPYVVEADRTRDELYLTYPAVVDFDPDPATWNFE